MRSLFASKTPLVNIFLTFGLQIFSYGVVYSADLPSFADLVERNGPTIVEISTSRQVEPRSPINDQELNDLLRRLNPGQEPDLDLENIP